MKLLTLIALGLLSVSAFAQPDSKFDTPYTKELMRKVRQQKKAEKASSEFRLEKSINLADGASATLKIYNHRDGARVVIKHKTLGSMNQKAGFRSVDYKYYIAEINADSLQESLDAISEGLTLEDKGIFTTQRVEVSSQASADKIDLFKGNQLVGSFSL